MKHFLFFLLIYLMMCRSLGAMDCMGVNSRVSEIESALRDHMQKDRLPGVALAIVSQEEVCLLKGYGFADPANKRPVSPETVFGLSSLSKTFTAAAIVDLVENGGMLSYGQNVEEFFPLQIKGRIDEEPVTVSSCLTHTAGLDDRTIGISARAPVNLIPLQRFLSKYLPPRVRTANKVSSYSNHGYALLGGIIEKKTRRSFAEVLRDRIFQPAGMKQSSFEQPLPAELEQQRSIAYNGGAPVPRIFFNDFPASGMFITASDMAKFMQALMGGAIKGDTDFKTIFSVMQQQRFTNHPSLPGLTYGFSERISNGIRVLQQGGDWQDYSSFLAIVPESQLGIFLAFNAPDGAPAAESILNLLLENSHKRQTSLEKFTISDTLPLEGKYRFNRYSRGTIAKIGILIGAVPEITIRKEGNELLAFRSRWIPVDRASLVFRRESDGAKIAFGRHKDSISHVFHEKNPYAAYEKVAWIQSADFHRLFILVLLVIFVAALLVLLLKRRKNPAERWLRISIAANLIYILLVAGVMSMIDPWEFQFGVPRTVFVVLLSSYALPIFSFVAGFYCVRSICSKQTSLKARFSFSFLSIALAAFLYFLHEWNLLGLHV